MTFTQSEPDRSRIQRIESLQRLARKYGEQRLLRIAERNGSTAVVTDRLLEVLAHRDRCDAAAAAEEVGAFIEPNRFEFFT